jgi:hypothetical protein
LRAECLEFCIERSDRFEFPRLPREWLDHLTEQMQGLKRVGEAWVVRKHVEHFPEDPALVILFRPTLLGSAKKLSAWMVAVLKCPAPTFFLAQSGVRGKVAQQIKSVGVRLI